MIGLWRRKQSVEAVEPAEAMPMPSIFERPAPPPSALFTMGELIPPVWRMIDATGAAETLRFLPDGRVLGASSGGAMRWELPGGCLTIGPEGGEPSWVFDRREHRDRRDVVLGRAESGGVEVALRRDLDDLQTAHSMRWPSTPILVVFNSASRPFDGRGTDWEFDENLADHDVDFVLLSERGDPAFGYLNKTGRVLERLRLLPAAGYREFVFLGQGTGGFAALMFAELLSYEFHDCRIRSVTINPVTAHGADVETALRGAAEASMLPPFLQADALSQKDCAVSSIRDLVRMSTRRREGDIEHRLLYDQDNPAQSFYAHPVDDLKGFTLQPVALGLPHEDGMATIRRSDLFGAGLAWGRER